MKEISELHFESSVKYFKEHTWARWEGDVLIVGISDYAQDQLGDIIFTDLPQPGDTFAQDEVFGVVESVKTTSDLFMPVGGEIVEINSALEDDPAIINTQPFAAGWMIKVKPENPAELDALMTAEEYKGSL